MEAVLMQRVAAAAARWRCAREAASLTGHVQRPGVIRLAAARRGAAGIGAGRARLGPARAHVSAERSTTEEDVDVEAVRLFVGLPEDVVCSDGRAVSRPRAVSAALRALKLLGVDGVELPVSWAVAQPVGPGEDAFEWAGYLAVAGMVRDAGLGLRVSLNTDGAALPVWAAAAAVADPDALFADREGNRRDGCLSFAVDEVPVLGGKSPVEAYEALFRSFGDAFAEFMGTTVTDVTVSLGPNGELRYPSYPPGSGAAADDYAGAGEFQCYDAHALANLKRHAESAGQRLWGLSGPHDGPRYHESPESSAFFRESGGSWATAYGDFFLSWYAGELLAHGDRILAAASRAFRAGNGKPGVQLSAKVPLLPQTGSRAAAATAGFHGGYSPVAEMFARHDCTVIVSGVIGPRDEAEEVLARVKGACAEHGTRLAAESAPLAVACDGNTVSWAALLSGERTAPCQFTYQRMGAEFFAPSHWPLFVQFLRDLEFPEEAHEDDLPAAGERLTVPSSTDREAQGEAREVQTV